MIRVALQEVLNQRGITQTQLAEMSGVRRARINELCREEVQRLELAHVESICRALDVSPWDWIIWSKEC